MTTNDKKPPRTTKTKTAKIAAGAAETPVTVRRAEGVYSSSVAGAPAGASVPGAAQAPSSTTAADAMKAAGAMKSAGLKGAVPAKSSRAAKPRKDAGSPPGTPTGESPAIKAINVSVTPRYREDRHASIAKAAYFRSEARGFAPGHEVEDWLAAEEEVDQRLLGEGRAS